MLTIENTPETAAARNKALHDVWTFADVALSCGGLPEDAREALERIVELCEGTP